MVMELRIRGPLNLSEANGSGLALTEKAESLVQLIEKKKEAVDKYRHHRPIAQWG